MNTIAKRALPILRDLKAGQDRWEEHAAEAARQGYRPHYCPHGTNWWVDYDPMCYWCEMGITIYERAIEEARRLDAEDRRLVKAAAEMFAAMRESGALQSEVEEFGNILGSILSRRYQ